MIEMQTTVERHRMVGPPSGCLIGGEKVRQGMNALARSNAATTFGFVLRIFADERPSHEQPLSGSRY
jgi:hypothetical protein